MIKTRTRAAALSFSLALAPLAGPLAAADSPWQPDVRLSAGNNDNLGQAERKRDIIEDNFATLNLGLAYRKDLNPGQQLTLRAFLETEQWDEVRDISRLSAGGQFLFDWQPTPGPTAPSFQANVMVRADDYDHKQRDSTVISTQLSATKPFSDRFRATLGVEYKVRDSSGTVWDLDHVRGFLSGVFAFRPGWSVHGTYNYIDGDVWSTAQTTFANGLVASDLFGLISASEAIEPDEAFNEAFCGLCRWHAYRLPAKTNIYEIGINKDIGRDMQVDLSFLEIDVDARGDNEYDTQVFRVSLSKRF